MHSLCVFCGANTGVDQQYQQAAQEFGSELARRSIRLVYGGGSVGLMGCVADAVLAGGGQVTGVLPRFLATRELLHEGVQDMRIVNTMHERKALMAELSEGFIALPGGLGTFEELFEVLTWTQLGLYEKPIGLLNTQGFYDPLIDLIQHATHQGFCRPEHLELFFAASSTQELLEKLPSHRPPKVRKWLVTDEQI